MALDVIALGTSVGTLLNNIFDQLPTHQQRVMEEFFEFSDRYKLEIARDDADFDDLVIWKDRKELLMETIINSLRK